MLLMIMTLQVKIRLVQPRS